MLRRRGSPQSRSWSRSVTLERAWRQGKTGGDQQHRDAIKKLGGKKKAKKVFYEKKKKEKRQLFMIHSIFANEIWGSIHTWAFWITIGIDRNSARDLHLRQILGRLCDAITSQWHPQFAVQFWLNGSKVKRTANVRRDASFERQHRTLSRLQRNLSDGKNLCRDRGAIKK